MGKTYLEVYTVHVNFVETQSAKVQIIYTKANKYLHYIFQCPLRKDQAKMFTNLSNSYVHPLETFLSCNKDATN